MGNPTRRCYVCGEDNPNVLQEHHLIPQRKWGLDTSDNIYILCANCHQAIESMYNDQFYSDIRAGMVRKDFVGTDVMKLLHGNSVGLSDVFNDWEMERLIEELWNQDRMSFEYLVENDLLSNEDILKANIALGEIDVSDI